MSTEVPCGLLSCVVPCLVCPALCCTVVLYHVLCQVWMVPCGALQCFLLLRCALWCFVMLFPLWCSVVLFGALWHLQMHAIVALRKLPEPGTNWAPPMHSYYTCIFLNVVGQVQHGPRAPSHPRSPACGSTHHEHRDMHGQPGACNSRQSQVLAVDPAVSPNRDPTAHAGMLARQCLDY